MIASLSFLSLDVVTLLGLAVSATDLSTMLELQLQNCHQSPYN